MFPTFDKQDDVPEGFRDSYVEQDGKWVAKTEDVTGLKNSVAATRKERDQAAKEARELRERIAALETERQASAAGLSSEKLKEIQAQAEAKFKKDLEERDALRSELRSLKLDSSVKSILSKADVIDPDAAWKIVGDEYDLTDDGKPILKSDPTADIEKYITGTVRQKYPFLFKGTQASGGGAAGQQKAGSKGNPKVSSLTGPDLEAYIEQNGPDAYQKALSAEMVAAYAAATAK